jgi:predicted GTPase
VLPAMGYGSEQIRDLEKTLAAAECDLVLFATPIDLPALLDPSHPALRVRYEYRDGDPPLLADLLLERLDGIL